MKFLKNLLFLSLAAVVLNAGFARAQVVNDWYIKDYKSKFVLNKNSTMEVAEDIVADCGNAPDKHGIFRVLPLFYQKTASEQIKTPIDLQSISDFSGKNYSYSETINKTDKTVSWKIGDANRTVQGVNNYRIKYLVKNVIRFSNPQFDEFYWNLNGNFWELTTDHYTGTIVFPAGVDSTNTKINLYSGDFGQDDIGLADSRWEGNSLVVESKRELNPKEGITISVTVPKGFFKPYILSQTDLKIYENQDAIMELLIHKYLLSAEIIWIIILFVICFFIWNKNGKDPKINRAVAPEFGIPNKLIPIEMGMVESFGNLKSEYITAEIVNLAVSGYLAIEDIGKTNILTGEDYKLKLTGKLQDSLNDSQKLLIEEIFGARQEVLISELRYKFYSKIPQIKKTISDKLTAQGIINKKGNSIKAAMIALAIFPNFFLFSPIGFLFMADPILFLGPALSFTILMVFAFLMPSRTTSGAEIEMKIRGFRMYMETAEKYRQQFNEKENIMEKLLPYAILFGMTKSWIEKIRKIYSEEYFNNYQPVWLQGAMLTGGHFDINHLADSIESMSSNMASTMASSPSSSGAGGFSGGGFSGGGGGGGGGGGW